MKQCKFANISPVTGITLLTDIRAQSTFDDFKLFFSGFDLYQHTGCPLITPYILPRLFYFSTKEQDLFNRTRYFADSKAYLFEWLTGDFVTDVSTAAATQCFNLHSYQWDGLLAAIGLSADQFPAIQDGTTYLRPLKNTHRLAWGLKKEVKVLLGVYDGAALAMGLSGLQPGCGIINLGTSAMLRVPGKYPVFDKNENKKIQPYALKRNCFLNNGALNNAALSLNWLRTQLFDVDLRNLQLMGNSTNAPLFCLPYLTGERDSKTGPYASGVFFGLRQNHTKTDIARAVLEGVAYSMNYIFDALKENGLQVNQLYMGGGGIQIPLCPQIFSDIRPAHYPVNRAAGRINWQCYAGIFGSRDG